MGGGGGLERVGGVTVNAFVFLQFYWLIFFSYFDE